MVVLEFLAIAVGFSAMVFASQSAVGAASELAIRARISPFVIGFTLMAVGTDLPEIANSVASSVTGHGDINVGDSVGSAATQATLVLGLLGIVSGPLPLPDGNVSRIGILSVVSLTILLGLMSDGDISRFDALVLLTAWIAGSIMIHRRARSHHQLTLPDSSGSSRLPLLGQVAGSFLCLGLASVMALWGITAVAERFDTPEFLIGFFVAAVGTSLPELVFDLTALRRGSTALAIGDVLGSSFVDTTASVAAGPLLAPIEVTRGLAMRGTIVAAIAIAFVTFVLSRVEAHDWRTGAILLFTYAGFFVAML